ncbi:MAG: ribonuclease Z [Muribaculaceae bacterium]|nr:ribonuclease Z [Muribaculaceae bacterium]
MTRFELNILGCGSATTTLRHVPSCQVLNVRDNLFMIDCGEGAQLAMRRMKLKFSRLNHIFISHLHGDHCFGLPGLLSTLALQGKTSSVTVHVFEDGARLLQQAMDYFCRERPYELKFNIITTRKAVIYEDDAITVTTVPLRHRVPAVGFIFSEKPKLRHIDAEAAKYHNVPLYAFNSLRQGEDFVTPEGIIVPNSHLTTSPDRSVSYAYCSDTVFSKRVINAVKGVDWLYHEATYGDENAVKARKRFHSTAREAGIVAREAGAKRLIIGHYSKRYLDETPLLEQAQEEFPQTLLSNEGLTIDLNKF